MKVRPAGFPCRMDEHTHTTDIDTVPAHSPCVEERPFGLLRRWEAISSATLGCVLSGRDLSGFYEVELSSGRWDELRLTQKMLARTIEGTGRRGGRETGGE